MLDWLTPFAQKPDHPMDSIEEAERLLSDLPTDPLKALEEVTSWLTTITSASGFRLATRISVVKRVDEAGQRFEPRLSQQYLTSRRLNKFEWQRLWRMILEFWERLADAYRVCLDEMRRDPRLLREQRDELPLLIVRTLRALTTQVKMLHLRYPPVRENLWQPLFDLYQLSEIQRCDSERLRAYAGDAVQTSARRELLRVLMLNTASPESIRPQQIELTIRVAARFGDSFLFKHTPEPGCNWYVDLAQARRPEPVSRVTTLQPTMRFFGAGAAITKIEEVIRRLTTEPSAHEEHFGADYSPLEKVMMLKHLLRYWGENPPRRREARDVIEAHIVVAHGFKAATRLLTRIEVPTMGEVTHDMDIQLKTKLGLGLLAEDPAKIPREKWLQHDTSTWGVSVGIPGASESWVTIGALCALESGRQWRIGVVRRLFHDSEQHAHAGIEVLAKKPVSVWLRGVGEGATRAENWATSSGSFAYDYLNVILLLVASAPRQHELVAQRGAFATGIIYEAMVGENPHYLRFEELLERGEDFDRVRFTWLTRRT